MKAVVMRTLPPRIVLAAPRIVLAAPRIVLAGWLLVIGSPFLVAQGPLTLPEDVADESLQQVVVPLSDAVKRRITEALRKEGQADGQRDAPVPSSGDPILDDVLDVIRRQGSVLDGSFLEVPSDDESGRAELPSRAPLRFSDSAPPIPGSGMPIPRYAADGGDGEPTGDARFHVAESLLRAARKLAALPGGDVSRNRLVAAMREQATVLLIDEFSQEFDPR